jgi:hypothetical protein
LARFPQPLHGDYYKPKLLQEVLMARQVIDSTQQYSLGSAADASKMHRFMVNIKVERIFNRIFEIQKSTRNAKKNAKIRAFGTSGSSVYQVRINQIEPATSLHAPLTRLLILGLSTLPA